MAKDAQKGSLWIVPAELQAAQERVRLADPENLDLTSDFGSYRALVSGKTESGIEMHNATGVVAEHYAAMLRQIAGMMRVHPASIVDIGCGAGFIAAEVGKAFPSAKIHGYDIASDAIAYATAAFPRITFEEKAVFAGTPLGKKFDLVYANEFYPFTRTDSLEIHLGTLEVLLDSLTEGGTLVLSMVDKPGSILMHEEAVRGRFGAKFAIHHILLPLKKIYSRLPVMGGAQFLTRIVNRLTNREPYIALVFQASGG